MVLCEPCHLGCSALGMPRSKTRVREGMVTVLRPCGEEPPAGSAWAWLSFYDRRRKETFVVSLALKQLMREADTVYVILNSGSKPELVGLASFPGYRCVMHEHVLILGK